MHDANPILPQTVPVPNCTAAIDFAGDRQSDRRGCHTSPMQVRLPFPFIWYDLPGRCDWAMPPQACFLLGFAALSVTRPICR